MSARLQPPESWIYRMAMEGGFLTLRDVGVFPWFGHNVIFPDLPPWPTYSIPTFTIYFGMQALRTTYAHRAQAPSSSRASSPTRGTSTMHASTTRR